MSIEVPRNGNDGSAHDRRDAHLLLCKVSQLSQLDNTNTNDNANTDDTNVDRSTQEWQ